MIPREMPPRSSASAPTPLKMMNAVPSVRSVRHNWALNVGSSCWV